MKLTQWEKSRLDEAKSLVLRAVRHQAGLLETDLTGEVIEGSTPVIWFGDPARKNWVTVATNPSTREFLNDHGELLLGEKARFFVRQTPVANGDISDEDVEAIIQSYRNYFYRKAAYRRWFGKKAKLEGFLNGMGGSLYGLVNHQRVVHTDFYPIPTMRQMGNIKQKEDILNGTFAREILRNTLSFLDPSLIIVLGAEHCPRIERVGQPFTLGEVRCVSGFADAKYQIGLYKDLDVPVLGLHFKPSEQFMGLGGKADPNGLHHGKYATAAAVRAMGDMIMADLNNEFPGRFK